MFSDGEVTANGFAMNGKMVSARILFRGVGKPV